MNTRTASKIFQRYLNIKQFQKVFNNFIWNCNTFVLSLPPYSWHWPLISDLVSHERVSQPALVSQSSVWRRSLVFCVLCAILKTTESSQSCWRGRGDAAFTSYVCINPTLGFHYCLTCTVFFISPKTILMK